MDRTASEKASFSYLSTEAQPLILVPKDAEVDEPVQPRCSRRRRVLLAIAGLLLALAVLALIHGYHIPRCINRNRKHQHAVLPTIEKPAIVSKQSLVPTESKIHRRAANAICTSDVCHTYAKEIKASFAKNYKAIDPCIDMNTYACEGWRDSHDYRPEQADVSVTSVMSDYNVNLTRDILESPYLDTYFTGDNKTQDKANFDKMKLAYSTCMNEDAIKAVGLAPIRQLLQEFEIQYPAVAPKTAGNVSNTEELTNVLIWLAKRGVEGFITSDTDADAKNPDVVVISISPGSDGLPSKEYYKKPAVVANYTRTAAEMIQVISSGQPWKESTTIDAASMDTAKKIIELERKISTNSPDPEAFNDPLFSYNPMTPMELDQLVPQISISKYLKAQAPPTYDVKTVIVSTVDYYKNLSSIIRSADRQTLHDYLQWRLIEVWGLRLHNDFNRPLRRFANIMAGKDPDAVPVRWRTCLKEVDFGLGWIESGFFVQRAFGPQSKEFGDRIIHDIKDMFTERFKGLDWMSDTVKTVAAKKVANIIQKVGYSTVSPNVMDPNSLRDWYASMKISDNYFQNGIEYNKFNYNKAWNDLLKPVDKTRWSMTMPEVNAYYNPSFNEIVFPAGIMQLPAFGLGLPEYVSYGAFGAAAGHELSHGFDNSGSLYDQTGRLTPWWDNKTLANFGTRTQCFIDQFNKFTVPGLEPNETLHVNGKLTQGENIADTGGLTTAYRAWRMRDKANSNPGLPGLEEYTNDQLFFISYANSWCGKMRNAQQVKIVLTNEHSPYQFRINGALANSGAFREAFNCPVKQPTCELW